MDYELIVTIVNRGFNDVVMDAARQVGARGGTIINARGAGAHEAEKLFGIPIQPEKEMILILAEKALKAEIMSAIIHAAGLNTVGQGLCFSLAVEDVMGVALLNAPQDEKKD